MNNSSPDIRAPLPWSEACYYFNLTPQDKIPHGYKKFSVWYGKRACWTLEAIEYLLEKLSQRNKAALEAKKCISNAELGNVRLTGKSKATRLSGGTRSPNRNERNQQKRPFKKTPRLSVVNLKGR